MHVASEEIVLWNSFRNGDTLAFEAIYNLYYARLNNYGHRFTADAFYVEQALQNLFVKLWNSRNKIGETTSVKNYLYLSFRRILLRQLKPSKKIIALADESKAEHFSFELSPETNLINKERLAALQQKLQAALQQLNARQREIIYLKFYEDLSYQEIAAVMNLTVKSTYKLLYRSIETLKSQLGNFAFLLLYWLVLKMH